MKRNIAVWLIVLSAMSWFIVACQKSPDDPILVNKGVLATLKRTIKNRTGGKIEEEKEKKGNGKEGTQIYSGIQGTDGGAI